MPWGRDRAGRSECTPRRMSGGAAIEEARTTRALSRGAMVGAQAEQDVDSVKRTTQATVRDALAVRKECKLPVRVSLDDRFLGLRYQESG